MENRGRRCLRRPVSYPATTTTFVTIARDAILSELTRCIGPNSARRAFHLMAELRDLKVAR
jgi:hypothetical protein